jgi:hypothetical protein
MREIALQVLVLKTWPNCQNRFYSAGEDAVVRLWALDKGEASPGEWKVNGKVRRTAYHATLRYCNDLKRFKQHCEGTPKVTCDAQQRPSPCKRSRTEGVYWLEYILQQHYIASAGFDHDIFVWNPLLHTPLYSPRPQLPHLSCGIEC